MKNNNMLLVIDLEATSSEDEHGNQVNNDIIQIGAVLLSRELEVVSNFGSLVKPNEMISPFITELTGISNEQVATAPEFREVAKMLEAWIRENCENIKIIRLCAWGTYFDIPLLRKSYQKSALRYPFSGTALDAKTFAFMWMSLSDHRTDKLSVAHVAKIMKIEPEGSYHDALVDAKTEAQILIRVFKDLKAGGFLNGKLIKLS